ncbi:two-component system chemotaxis sensor kinase CheA [Blastomonas natatoria]|uniref:Chemotaxis protein CheA n=1 Tax=Blastomonas natatoria TaxID=34015 RepID=A0A2V3V8U5_9SPHN|nr:chemotaxis protein CheA [Blastomonas natatoria]PXW77584.1 two-component system chemotaxis sensor kinase CheA [Blastomonas natatoria]
MDDLIQEFIAETRETLDALASELVLWEQNPRDSARLDAIFRFVHTVKGSCGFLNLPRFERLSHAAEDVLAQVRDGKREASGPLVDAVLAIIDRIGELIVVMETGDALPDGADADLIAALNRNIAPPTADPDEEEITVRDEPDPVRRQNVVRSIRVPLELIDHLMNGVSDMVLARNEVARCLRDEHSGASLENAFERLSACIADMRDAIGQTRMQRIERIFSPLPRLVRDLSTELGKQVDLRTSGNNVELDREMIEMIRDPLTHIIRNAIDHGIETPARRRVVGKPETGRLSISARQSGNQILIEIADDGRGIDIEKLTARALAAKVRSSSEINGMSERARLELIFAPGLSTADNVTAISGRGVGMDVVRSNIERIGGSIDLENYPGRGLRVILRVPLTLTIIPCLTVRAGGQEFAMPRSAIREILFDSNSQVRIQQVGGSDLAYIRGECLPYVALETLLGLDMDAEPQTRYRTIVTVNAASDLRYALSVEAVIDHEELVVRPGAPVIMADGLYAGTTLPDNGRPMLLLDPLGLAHRARLNEMPRPERSPAETDEASPESDGGSALLFRELSGQLRLIALAAVERVEDADTARMAMVAGNVRLNIDGESRPVIGLSALPEEDCAKLLHLTDGRLQALYAVDDVIDIVRLPSRIDPASQPGLVGGIALIGDLQLEVVDVHWIFSMLLGAPPESVRPACGLIGGDDPWTRHILAPLVAAAGYRPVMVDGEAGGLDGLDPAITIIVGDSAASPGQLRGQVIRLSDTMNAAGADPDTIYRYDRATLLGRLIAGQQRQSA